MGLPCLKTACGCRIDYKDIWHLRFDLTSFEASLHLADCVHCSESQRLNLIRAILELKCFASQWHACKRTVPVHITAKH
eukprot:250972-Amphidinium_carterae.1